jgi:hypothetical protein
MKRIFTVRKGIPVPDGTAVFPFFDGLDKEIGLPWKSQEGFSIAFGKIAPHQASKIHVMPWVTQVTVVLRGLLEAWMKDPDSDSPYALKVVAQEAILTRPGTFLQLINPTDSILQVLYIVSPPFVFEADSKGKVLYNDALVFDEGWEELKRMNWFAPQDHPDRWPTAEARRAALDRMIEKKRQRS